MSGAVVGLIVGVVAVAAWLGGRRRGPKSAVLPRKTVDDAREAVDGQISFPETPQKVINQAVAPQNSEKKVIEAGGLVQPSGAAAQRPAGVDPTTGVDPEPAPKTDREPAPPPPRILVGARPDAGTTLRLAAPVLGWPEHVLRDREIGQAFDAAGSTVEFGRRGDGGDVLVLRARGQARLLIWPTHAELVVGSRALDTLGGIEGWAREWLTWASAWLLGARLEPARVLEAADELGWTPVSVDLAADLGGWGPLLDEHQDPDRWTQQTVPIPVPAGRGLLASIQLGEKSSHPLSVYGYDKTRWAARTGRGAAWLERMRQAGRVDHEAVWRWELRLRGDALQLRRRGREEIEVDFRRCATLADQDAIARVWAYAVGNVDATKPSGHYRLVVPAERFDEQGRGVPSKRTRAVDPLWRLVQQAGGSTPVESLAQVRARKEAARVEWRRKAEGVALRGLAAMVALDELEDPVAAGELALVRARELVEGERWVGAHALQVAATHDIREEPPEPEPPDTPEPPLEPDPPPDRPPPGQEASDSEPPSHVPSFPHATPPELAQRPATRSAAPSPPVPELEPDRPLTREHASIPGPAPPDREHATQHPRSHPNPEIPS